MDQASRNRNPVPEGTRVHVQILPKQILVHRHRRSGVAAKGELHSRIEADGIAEKVENRVDANIEARVIGVSVLNSPGIREECRTPRIALSNYAGNGWPAIQTHVVPRRSDGFH